MKKCNEVFFSDKVTAVSKRLKTIEILKMFL